MNALRNAILFAFAAAGILLCATGDAAADAVACDVPIIVQQGNVPPNVLIIMDDSGSMNEAMLHAAFNPAVVYSGAFTSDQTYYISTTGLYKPKSFKSTWPNLPTATLVAGVNGEQGRYLGNYLNWIFYHATAAQRLTLPLLTKFHAGRAAVQTLITSATGLRYGLMGFNVDNGGKLYAAPGTPTATITTKLMAMAPESWTPSAETMMTAMSYFKATGAGAWITAACQSNFIIFVTDGYPTQDLNVPGYIDHFHDNPGTCASIGAIDYPASNNCSSWLDDAAYYMSHTDMRADLTGNQYVYTYTIGFGIDAPLLLSTAQAGGGTYQVAWDLQTLVQTLGTVIGDIVRRISSGAAVAVVSTEQGNGDRLYRGKFMPGLWRGYLESYTLPYHNGDSPAWEAGSLLEQRSPAARNLLTMLSNGTAASFDATHAADLQSDLGAANQTVAANLINWVRGENVLGLRNRQGWKLGDLVYSTPLVVGAPSSYFVTSSYQQFLRDHQDRAHTVYVGANDGMLHAFNGDTGSELWGYVPRGVLSHLSALADTNYCHVSFVDLSPCAFDVNFNGTWKTVLVGGLRAGGNSYFAVDVTSPTQPEILWETPIAAIKSSFTEPAVIRKHNGTYLWTGSGPDAAGNARAAVLNMATGEYLASRNLSTINAVNMGAGATTYDADWDGITDYIYQGDLQGNLYRFDVRSEVVSAWVGAVVYAGSQPIQTRPEIALSSSNTPMVYFGTGKYVDATDFTTTAVQSFVCIADDGTKSGLTKANLVDQSSTIHDLTGKSGWFFNLTRGDGERVVEPAAVVEGVVYFTSFAPRSAACSGGGKSWLYHVDFKDGSNPDHNGNEQQQTDQRVEDLGDGVASKPVVNLGDATVIVQTSDARLNLMDLRTPPQWMSVRAWRELFNNANPNAVVNGQ
jgi:type IV pilus assembly protein PilY1